MKQYGDNEGIWVVRNKLCQNNLSSFALHFHLSVNSCNGNVFSNPSLWTNLWQIKEPSHFKLQLYSSRINPDIYPPAKHQYNPK